MSKSLKDSNLSERRVIPTLLAVSLCASIAAFGCTTDRNVGNGDPVVTPGLRTSPTGGATTGTETESVPPPMMSSYSGAQALPAVQPRVARISREEAALLLTEMQPRVKVLGPVAPGPSPSANGRVYASDQIALRLQSVEARSTINSSIYSPAPDAGIISGAGEPVGGVTVIGGDVLGAGVTPTSNVAGTATTATAAATATPTGTAIATPSALGSVRTLSPTAAAVVNPPASISGSPALATVSSARTGGTVVRGNTITAGTVNTQAPTTQSVSGTTSIGVNPVRVMTTNGRVTVTNVTSTSGRQQ
ncbi:MAG: hypothetical protein ACJ74H_13390 [Thermoanaerobaculia bacterium]